MKGLILVAIPVDTEEADPAVSIGVAFDAVGPAAIPQGLTPEVVTKRFVPEGEDRLATEEEVSANTVDLLEELGFTPAQFGLSNVTVNGGG